MAPEDATAHWDGWPRRLYSPALAKFSHVGCIGVASYGALGNVFPLDFQLFNFSGHFRAAQTLWHWTLCGCLAYPERIYRPIALSLFIAWISLYFCVSPLNYFINSFVPLLAPNPGDASASTHLQLWGRRGGVRWHAESGFEPETFHIYGHPPRCIKVDHSYQRKVKGKGRTLVIAPLSRQSYRRGAQVHGAHQAASHIPALNLPSRSRHSFTDHERMEGWVNPGPGCKEQLAHGCYGTACS